MNGLKYKKLNDFEMSNITGGKWVTKTIVTSECIGRDIYGNCNQFHVFTYTYEYNTKTHEERNKHRDTYNPEQLNFTTRISKTFSLAILYFVEL